MRMNIMFLFTLVTSPLLLYPPLLPALLFFSYVLLSFPLHPLHDCFSSQLPSNHSSISPPSTFSPPFPLLTTPSPTPLLSPSTPLHHSSLTPSLFLQPYSLPFSPILFPLLLLFTTHHSPLLSSSPPLLFLHLLRCPVKTSLV